jgi:hypothetical protein
LKAATFNARAETVARTPRGAKLLTRDEARRIAANFAELPGLVGEARLDFSERPDATPEITTRQDSVLLSPTTRGGWPLRLTGLADFRC